ncbi:hypothetical protein Pd630_LPD05286 [Rhodococcus opacus PD630]|nr:hypothetical protein Pd630_LPD05286 [Rhodococcus opacus PD630]
MPPDGIGEHTVGGEAEQQAGSTRCRGTGGSMHAAICIN